MNGKKREGLGQMLSQEREGLGYSRWRDEEVEGGRERKM